MSNSLITVINLSKVFRVPIRPEGIKASVKSLLHPSYAEINAVDQLNFCIEQGEMVGMIGPNGAGKTTTLKMMSGLLFPTSGEIRVAGNIPCARRTEYLRSISMLLGNKSQMLWDIPPIDSFRVLSEIYSIPKPEFRRTLDELVDLLEMKEILNKPVRNLSLGERMKCELTASLLHSPALLFLDEPTLGLDVSMQLRLRRFLSEYNRRSGVTVILTSHYMADVMALCPRVVLIHHGNLLYDGALEGLAHKLIPFKLLKITLNQETITDPNMFEKMGWEDVEILEKDANIFTLRVARHDTPAITARILQSFVVADLSVEDPPIEAVIDQIYSGGVA